MSTCCDKDDQWQHGEVKMYEQRSKMTPCSGDCISAALGGETAALRPAGVMLICTGHPASSPINKPLSEPCHWRASCSPLCSSDKEDGAGFSAGMLPMYEMLFMPPRSRGTTAVTNGCFDWNYKKYIYYCYLGLGHWNNSSVQTHSSEWPSTTPVSLH